jgi:hypothetical protein
MLCPRYVYCGFLLVRALVNRITNCKQHHNVVVMTDTLFDQIPDERSFFTHQSECKLWMLKFVSLNAFLYTSQEFPWTICVPRAPIVPQPISDQIAIAT